MKQIKSVNEKNLFMKSQTTISLVTFDSAHLGKSTKIIFSINLRKYL